MMQKNGSGKMKPKRKLKKEVIYVFAGLVAILVIGILGFNFYNDYTYKQTNEYKLLEKGYSKEDANIIEKNLKEETIQKILSEEKNDAIPAIIQEKYYLEKNFDKYVAFQKENTEKSTYDIVAMVNTKANLDWYEDIKEVDTSQKDLILVNKFNQLKEDYSPENLVEVSNWYCYGTNQITQETYDAFINLYNAAMEKDIKIIINSSYRNYQNQEETYNQLKNTYGSKKADDQAARPGHSEHETGLAIDVFTPGNTTTENFKDSEAYKWLKENAQNYGFIERYPEGKEYLTGYHFESWHWRYVGIEVAKQIHDEQITYDEYYAYYIEK